MNRFVCCEYHFYHLGNVFLLRVCGVLHRSIIHCVSCARMKHAHKSRRVHKILPELLTLHLTELPQLMLCYIRSSFGSSFDFCDASCTHLGMRLRHCVPPPPSCSARHRRGAEGLLQAHYVRKTKGRAAGAFLRPEH